VFTDKRGFAMRRGRVRFLLPVLGAKNFGHIAFFTINIICPFTGKEWAGALV
jgi:uncharacterized membrane protein YuzA (DUF378 family)